MLGAAQGVLLLLLVLFRYRHRANVPLALLLLTFAVRLGTIPSWTEATLLTHRWFLILTGPLPLLFGPLVWWYIRELTVAGRPPARPGGLPARPRYLPLHTLPFLAETAVLTLLLLPMNAADYTSFVTATFSGNPPWWMSARHLGKLASGVSYAVPSFMLAFASPDVEAPCTDVPRAWPKVVVLSPFLSLLAFVVAAFWPETAAETAAATATGPGAGAISPLVIPAVAMMASIYTFSLIVIIAPQSLTVPVGKIFEADVPLEPDSRAGGIASRAPADPHGCFEDAPGVSPADVRTHLPDAECRRIAELVRAHLERGACLDPDLSLRAMADEIGVTPNRLSAAVNGVFGENFCRLVNRYRLDYFTYRISTGALDTRTVLDVALEAGFPSKSTFNRVFKQYFGTAPSRYAREMVTAEQQRRRSSEFTNGSGGAR